MYLSAVRSLSYSSVFVVFPVKPSSLSFCLYHHHHRHRVYLWFVSFELAFIIVLIYRSNRLCLCFTCHVTMVSRAEVLLSLSAERFAI